MLHLKICKVGNSLGAVFPREALTRTGIAGDDGAFIIETQDGYQITPYDPELDKQMRVAEEGLAVAAENLRNNHPADSASRAYYPIFHAATAVLLEKGVERSSHKGVISAFGEIFIKGDLLEKRFHEYSRGAFDARILSDYFPSPSPDGIHADEILSNAGEFIKACQNLLGE